MTLLFETSCRKPTLPESDKNLKSELQSGVGSATIDIRDITSKLPKTILYNCGDSLKMYLDRTQWKYEQDYLQLRIPLNASNTLFLYGTKYYDSTNTNAYLVQFVPDAGSNDSLYSGKQLWIDLQTWTGNGLRYVNDSVVASLKPIALADSNWEQCMLESGMFEIDSKGKIRVKNNKDNLTSGGPYDCWHEGGKFWSNLGATFTKIIAGLGEIFDDGGSNGNSGGGGSGGNWQITIGGWTNGGAGAPSGTPSGGFGNGNGSPPGNPPLTGGSNFAIPTPDENVQVEQPDENGFYPSRIAVADIMFQNSSTGDGAIDCSDFQGLIGNMWEKWQQLANYQIPSEVTQRMSGLIDLFSYRYNEDNFKILKIEDAAGPKVNCDFFALHINTLPKNAQNQVMEPDEFLDFFRKNLSMLDNLGNNTVGSYGSYDDSPNNGLNDQQMFGYGYGSSLGALAHFHNNLPYSNGFIYDDGSVIESGYSTTMDYTYWIYTTIKTPLDGDHPVSGNRMFGIQSDTVNGGYMLYLMGVDRVTGNFVSTVNSMLGAIVFNNADNWWNSIIAGTKNYINAHSGNSTLYSNNGVITKRIDWNGSFGQFLQKQLTLAQFKAISNCP